MVAVELEAIGSSFFAHELKNATVARAVIRHKTDVFIGIGSSSSQNVSVRLPTASIKSLVLCFQTANFPFVIRPMSTRILLAGILGGVVMFIWTSIAHMFLPLGEVGIREIPNEETVLSTLQTNIGFKDGLYIFPGTGVGKDATREEKREAMRKETDKMAKGPSGLLIYKRNRPFNFARALGIEFGTEVVEAILVVFLLAQTGITGLAGRVGFVLTAGILAAIATNVSYWNWYGFPRLYTAAYISIQIIGFLCVGIVAALVLGKRSGQSQS